LRDGLSKDKFVPVQAMKAYRGTEGQFHTFFPWQ